MNNPFNNIQPSFEFPGYNMYSSNVPQEGNFNNYSVAQGTSYAPQQAFYAATSYPTPTLAAPLNGYNPNPWGQQQVDYNNPNTYLQANNQQFNAPPFNQFIQPAAMPYTDPYQGIQNYPAQYGQVPFNSSMIQYAQQLDAFGVPAPTAPYQTGVHTTIVETRPFDPAKDLTMGQQAELAAKNNISYTGNPLKPGYQVTFR